MSRIRPSWYWMIPLLLLSFWLGARMLASDLFWNDEIWSLLQIGLPGDPLGTLEIWNALRTESLSPELPSYSMVLAGWVGLVGHSEAAARALSLLLGLLSAACTYRLGRDVAGGAGGLYAAALLAGSAVFVHYTHELRSYAVYILSACLLPWAYWLLLRRPGWRSAGLLVLATTFAAYTHILALITPAALSLYHLLFVRKNRAWLAAPAAMLAAAVLFLPWLVYLPSILAFSRESLKLDLALNAPELVGTLFVAFSSGNLMLLALLGLAALTGRDRPTLFGWTWLLGGLAVVLAVNAITPSFIHIRYLAALWPALALLGALGLLRLAERGIPAGWLVGVWLLVGGAAALTPDFFNSLPNSEPTTPRAGFVQALDLLGAYAGPDDVTVLHLSRPGDEYLQDVVLEYYLRDTPGTYFQMESASTNYFMLERDYRAAVDARVGNAPRVWALIVPDVPFSRRRSVVFDQLLQRAYAPCTQAGSPLLLARDDLHLLLYTRQPGTEPAALFHDGDIGVHNLLPLRPHGELLAAAAGWSVGPDVDVGLYSAALHIYDAGGALARQDDYGLPGEGFSCRYSALSLEGLSPGPYTAALLVYNWQTGERLAAADGQQIVELGSFTR